MEFLNSFFKSVNERLTSPLYGALLISTIIWNYDIFLTIFFVDNEAILKITSDKLMKATYIHDVLFPTVFGKNLLECIHPLFAYFISILWRIVPVFGLTWLFITQIPKLANKAHREERGFMKIREEENIKYEEEIAQLRLQNSKYQDALLVKEEADENKRQEILRLRKENVENTKRIKENNQEELLLGDDVFSPAERRKYNKIISDMNIRHAFLDMIKFVHRDNQNKDTVIDEFGIGVDEFDQFEQFVQSDLVRNQFFKPLGENKYKSFLYFDDFGKKVALQMVKDGYLKEEDLIGKI